MNAADNKQRDSSMNKLKVEIDAENNRIRVWNNGARRCRGDSVRPAAVLMPLLSRLLREGKGIPVVVHKEEGVHVPELIFGHLLTSSNYDDTVKKGARSPAFPSPLDCGSRVAVAAPC